MPKHRDIEQSNRPISYDPTSPKRVVQVTGIESPFEQISKALRETLEKNDFWQGLRPILEKCAPLVNKQSELFKEVKSTRGKGGKLLLQRFNNNTPMLDDSDMLKYEKQFQWFASEILKIDKNLKPELINEKDFMLKNLIENPENVVGVASEKSNIEYENVLLAINAVYQIFAVHEALRLRPLIEYKVWSFGFCPICGSSPEMGKIVPKEGHYYLVCSLCMTEWKYDRIGCPFCGSPNPDQVGHFTAEEYPSYQVNYCNKCKSYIKVSIEKAMNRRHLPIYDNLMSLELDLSAMAENFHSGEIQYWRC